MDPGVQAHPRGLLGDHLVSDRGPTERDWAIMYFAWMNSLTLSDTIWRYVVKERVKEHEGSCVKQPASCGLCITLECLEGGRKMKEAWEKRAREE